MFGYSRIFCIHSLCNRLYYVCILYYIICMYVICSWRSEQKHCRTSAIVRLLKKQGMNLYLNQKNQKIRTIQVYFSNITIYMEPKNTLITRSSIIYSVFFWNIYIYNIICLGIYHYNNMHLLIISGLVDSIHFS